MENFELLTILDCERAVRNYLKIEKVEPTSLAITRKSRNFLVKITVNSNNKDEILNFVVKPGTNTTELSKTIFEDFNKIIPKFEPNITSQAYYGNSRVLLFEDLTCQGFKVSNAKCLNLDQLQVALEVLASFHAGSLAYEDIKTKQLKRDFTLGDEYRLASLNWDKRRDLDAVSNLLNEKVMKKIPDFLNKLHKRQARQFKTTICHGNLKLDKIMFKTENGKPIACKLINFKSKLYAPPVYDVLQLIFLNSTSYLRQHHLDSLLRFYYNHLKIEVENYSLNIDKILPFDEILLSAHYILPLIKLEVVQRFPKNINAVQELEEILSFPGLTREDCYVIAKNCIGTTNYEFLSFQVLSLDETNGFLGNYLKLNIQTKYEAKEKVINCFVKCMPASNIAQGIVLGTGAFSKEVFFYQTMVPMLQNYGINIINECVPKCWLQRNEDIIVFENLDLQNYKMVSSRETLNPQTLSVVIRKLAKFHAAMMILGEKKSEELGRPYRLIDDYPEPLKEAFFLKNATHWGAKVWQTGLKSIPDVLNLLPDLKSSLGGQRFLNNFAQLSQRFYEAVEPLKHMRSTLNHGDLWTHNILFKNEDNVTVDCYLIDFQITRYCSPVQDLLFATHITTDRATRLKHEREFQSIYYEELSRVMAEYGYAIEQVFPYRQFVDSINFVKVQAVMQTIMYDSFGSLCTAEEVAELLEGEEEYNKKVYFEDRQEYVGILFAKSEVVRDRIRGDVEDLIDVMDQLEI